MVRIVPIVAAARAFVGSWSHDTCLIAVDIIGPSSGGSIPLAPLGRFEVGVAPRSQHRAPERGQPRRDRDVFQPFSAYNLLCGGGERPRIE